MQSYKITPANWNRLRQNFTRKHWFLLITDTFKCHLDALLFFSASNIMNDLIQGVLESQDSVLTAAPYKCLYHYYFLYPR